MILNLKKEIEEHLKIVLQGTSINCRERLEYEANGAQKPECPDV